VDKTIFQVWKTEKELFEAWECQIAEMAGLGTAFPPTLTPLSVLTTIFQMDLG